MAPEIALARIAQLPAGATLLDPMCGSGTVLRAGVEHGLKVIGIDVDPMARLMARVWSSPPTRGQFLHDVHELLALAERWPTADLNSLTWVDGETTDFINFWFGSTQRDALVRIAGALHDSKLVSADALRVALSRIIVTKERGASLARDTSHSRPHKVATESTYDVNTEFLKSARTMAVRLAPEEVRGSSQVRLGDARAMDHVADGSVDCVITSPPYLNAIDYLRGHRLSLVWLGYSAAEVRAIRGSSIGAENGLANLDNHPGRYISGPSGDEPPSRIVGWATRYLKDARAVSAEIARVLAPGGDAVMVVGNSTLKGFKVDNAQMYADAMSVAGLDVSEVAEREIPTRSRYLPTADGSALAARMRVECVIRASRRRAGTETELRQPAWRMTGQHGA